MPSSDQTTETELKHRLEEKQEGVRDADAFLSWLFGDDATGHLFACAVDDQGNGWKQGRWSETRKTLIQAARAAADKEGGESGEGVPDLAAYYSVGLFPDEPGVRRRKENVIGVVGLVLDDIGTKAGVDEKGAEVLEELEELQAIGAKIDTSPGNQHWVIKYKTDGQQWPEGEVQVGARGKRALDLHVLLVNAFAGLGAADRIGDVTRLVRLPAGKNLKKEPPSKRNFAVQMSWLERPGKPTGAFQADLAAVILRALGNDELAAQCETQAMLFGAALDRWSDDLWKEVKQTLAVAGKTRDSELGSGIGANANLCADLARPDPWLALQIELAERHGWMEPREGSAIGTVDCRCPFGDEHSTDDMIRYLGDGNWKCHHSSCGAAGRTVPDFKRRLKELWEEVRDVEAGEPSADGLIARWSSLGYDGVPQGVSGGQEQTRTIGGDTSDTPGERTTNEPSIEADEIAAAIGSEADRTLAVGRLLQRYVLVLDGPRGVPGWYDLKKDKLIPKAEIEQEAPVVELFEVGKTGQDAVWKVLSNDVRCERYDGFVSEPGLGRMIDGEKGERLINRWRGSDVLEAPDSEVGEPEVFLEFMDWFAGETGTVQRDTLDRYIAWILRNPTAKAPMTVCLVGGQGVGKDLLISLLARLVGRANVRKVPLEGLVSQYNGWQAARIVYVPEVDGKGRYELLSRIKDLSGGDGYSTINEKYERPYQARDVSIYWMTTNEDGALPIDLDSRRDFVVGCPRSAHPEGFEFYARLAAAIGENGSELGLIMRHYMRQVEMGDFSPYAPAPLTSAKVAMAEEGQSTGVTEIIEALEGRGLTSDGLDGVSEGERAMVSSWALAKYLQITCGIKNRGRGMSEAMRKIGWIRASKKLRMQRENQGARAYIWTPKSAAYEPEFLAVGDDTDDLVRQKIRRRVDAGDSQLLRTPIGVEKDG